MLDQTDNGMVTIEKQNVDWKEHPPGVHALAGAQPETFLRAHLPAKHQSAQARRGGVRQGDPLGDTPPTRSLNQSALQEAKPS
jgi:hypothetical protein